MSTEHDGGEESAQASAAAAAPIIQGPQEVITPSHPTAGIERQGSLTAAQLAEQNAKRDEILRPVFGEVGDLIADYTCAVESTMLLHGRVFLTTKFLCFYSNLFGLEKKIRIPIGHIKSISKENTALVIPNAISVSTHRKDYLFRSFWDRDECYIILKDLVDKAGKVKTVQRAKSFTQGSSTKSLEGSSIAAVAEAVDASRGNSSSSSSSASGGAAAAAAAGGEDESVGEFSTPQRSVKDRHTVAFASPSPSDAATTVRARPVTMMEARGGKTDGISFVHGRPSFVATSKPDDELDSEIKLSDVTEDSVVTDADVNYAPSFDEEWKKCVLKMSIVTGNMPVSVSEYSKLFLDEGSPHSIQSYHERVKDHSIVCTPWAPLAGALGEGREMKFVKPLSNVPGISSSRGCKVQRLRRFGSYGLIVCSSTTMEDVPAAHTFSVEDAISVRSVNSNEVVVEITYEVKFLKSTMFRYMIENGTNGEMTKWLKDLFNYLKETCEEYQRNASTGGDSNRLTEDDSMMRKTSFSDLSNAEPEAAPAPTPAPALPPAPAPAPAPAAMAVPVPVPVPPVSKSPSMQFISIPALNSTWIVRISIALIVFAALIRWFRLHGRVTRNTQEVDVLSRSMLEVSRNQAMIAQMLCAQSEMINELRRTSCAGSSGTNKWCTIPSPHSSCNQFLISPTNSNGFGDTESLSASGRLRVFESMLMEFQANSRTVEGIRSHVLELAGQRK